MPWAALVKPSVQPKQSPREIAGRRYRRTAVHRADRMPARAVDGLLAPASQRSGGRESGIFRSSGRCRFALTFT